MGWQLLSETKPRARTEHKCIWCDETINVGERYTRIVGVYYGEFQNDAWHRECADAAKKYFSSCCEDEFTPGEFVRGTTDHKW